MKDLDKTKEELLKELTELRKKEELLKILVHNIPDIVWIKDEKGTYLLCNEVFENIFGLKETELIGKSDFDFLDKQTATFYSQKDKIALKEGKACDNEEWIKFVSDGHEELFETIKKPIYDSTNNIIGVLGIARNINERTKIEEQLRLSEEKLELFFSQSLDGFFFMMLDKPIEWNDTVNKERILDYVFSHQFITKINDAMLDQYLAKREQFIGLTPNDLFAHNIEYGKTLWRELFDKGQIHIISNEKRFDQSDMWVEGDYNCIYDSNKRIIGHFGIQRDITERKRIENALIESENRYSAFINSSKDMTFLKDDNLRYLIINNAFASFFSISEDKIIGHSDFEIMGEESAKKCYESDQKALLTNDLVISNEQIGKTIFSTHKFKVPLSNAKFGVGGTIRDITEQMEIRKQLLEQAEKLKELNSTKDKFLSIISHDLRNPFNAFLGLTKIIAENLHELTLDEIQKIAVSMQNSAENLSSLLENLLTWSQSQRGLIRFNPELILLAEKVNSIFDIFYDSASKKSINLYHTISNDIVIKADAQMFDSLLQNLVFNAIKFTPKSGKITIQASVIEEGTVQISVIDNGIGMNSKIIDNLFQINSQENRIGTDGEPSSGLGLIICKEYIERHNGKIWAESEEGKGSAFHFTIPAGI